MSSLLYYLTVENPVILKVQSLFLLLVVVFACDKQKEKNLAIDAEEVSEYSPLAHQLLETSTLQIPIDYPVNELQRMINRIMPDTLVNDSIDLNDKSDYLVLKVLPIGQLLLNGYQNYLDASIPVKAYVNIKKKVAAINVKNKDAVEFKLRLDLHTTLSIDEAFNLNTECKIQRIQWIEEPKIKIAGIKINLRKKITKQLEKNSGAIETAICKAIDEAVPIQKEVYAMWDILNKTHRVAKKPIDIWLTTKPKEFSAQFDKNIKDTLRVLLNAKSHIMVSPLKGMELLDSLELPENGSVDGGTGLDLFVSIYMPYQYMDVIMNSQLEGREISYAGLTASLTNFETSTENEQLRLACQTAGDVDVNLIARARPTLNKERTLTFNNLTYEVESDNLLVNSLDWISNSSIDSYMLKYSKVPLAHILDSLDHKIVRALDRSNLSSKITLNLKFTDLSSDTIIYHNDRFEWIFSVDGNAHAYLTDSLVVK